MQNATLSTTVARLFVFALIIDTESQAQQAEALVESIDGFENADRELVTAVKQAEIQGAGTNVSLQISSETEDKIREQIKAELKNGRINPVIMAAWTRHMRERFAAFGHNLTALAIPSNVRTTLHPNAWTSLKDKFQAWTRAYTRMVTLYSETKLVADVAFTFPTIPAQITEAYTPVIAALESANIIALRQSLGYYMVVVVAPFLAHVDQVLETYTMENMKIDENDGNTVN